MTEERKHGGKPLDGEQLEAVTGGVELEVFMASVVELTGERGLTEDPRYKPLLNAIACGELQKVCELSMPLLYAGDTLIWEAYRKK